MLYNCIVIGLGGHGSSCISNISKNINYNILGIEKYQRNHSNGSSHGRSRIIRQAYFEDPRYVPLIKRSFELWRELALFEENESIKNNGEKPIESLLNMTGGLMIGHPDSTVVRGTLASISTHSLPHQIFNSNELKEKYPILTPDENTIGVFETEAGYLIPESCIENYYRSAEQNGAILHFEETFISWKTVPSNIFNFINSSEYNDIQQEEQTELIEVTTNLRTYITKKLVLTVGAWAPEIYGPSLPFKLRVERRVLYWIQPTETKYLESFKNLPVYIWDTNQPIGLFYGFPLQPGFPENSLKVAIHLTQYNESNQCTPDTINRQVSQEETDIIQSLLIDYIPSLGNGQVIHTETCMYTVTPNEHFLIDFHPQNNNIIIASPCSGHGFKFCSVIGEIIKDLVIKGTTEHDISLFRLTEFTK